MCVFYSVQNFEVDSFRLTSKLDAHAIWQVHLLTVDVVLPLILQRMRNTDQNQMFNQQRSLADWKWPANWKGLVLIQNVSKLQTLQKNREKFTSLLNNYGSQSTVIAG